MGRMPGNVGLSLDSFHIGGGDAKIEPKPTGVVCVVFFLARRCERLNTKKEESLSSWGFQKIQEKRERIFEGARDNKQGVCSDRMETRLGLKQNEARKLGDIRLR